MRRASIAPPVSPIRKLMAAKAFRAVYQPVVDLKTRKIFAYEALVRSTSPDFDSPPAMFDAAVADGFDFPALQHESGFMFFFNEVLVKGFFILDDAH